MAEIAVRQADPTLDEIRLQLAPEIAVAAVFDGWSETALDSAAQANGIDPDVARFAFPDGAMGMIGAWIESIDRAMERAFTPETIAAMPIRERIRALVLFRLKELGKAEEALRRALAIQTLPQNIAQSVKNAWSSADVMWRLAGDRATDYNHYSKRAILASIYAATLAVFVEDETMDKAETRAFLDRRIEGVMRFEKAKARLFRDRETFSVVRFLGRLRYPAR
ncbi:COQ9 family protein [Altericroceibacterium xinjiangense]|uniref:COQ9 family protein n=1 Tax=Altericroceibacterium xinjiangense TaxID=762261 RepID=UPI000F7EB9C1|nr:COQ9 family protein [Altericroceibacterium xinjiangense]